MHLPRSPIFVGFLIIVHEAGEDEVAYKAPKSTADRCLTVEQREPSAGFEARVEEGKIYDGD